MRCTSATPKPRCGSSSCGRSLMGDSQWHLDFGRRLPLRVRVLNEQKLSHGKPTMVDVQLHSLAVALAVCSNQQCCSRGQCRQHVAPSNSGSKSGLLAGCRTDRGVRRGGAMASARLPCQTMPFVSKLNDTRFNQRQTPSQMFSFARKLSNM